MARIFTIDFEFKGANHAAIVSTWTGKQQAASFQVLLYDEALCGLAPDGIIRFNTIDITSEPKTIGDELEQCLKKAQQRISRKSHV